MATSEIPMVQINAADVAHNWPALLRRVQAGEALVIVQAGQPVAEVLPPRSQSQTLRPYGLCAGEFIVPDDFDAPLPDDFIYDFEGR